MGDWVHLTNLYNDVEADIVEALLQSNNIQSRRVYPKNSAITKIIMGRAIGVDIFVRSEDYEVAKEIIDTQVLDEDNIIVDENEID